MMSNHFHLVLETPKANLVAGMKWFLGTYTSRFNRRHKLFGHLFSGRYKSLIVDGSGDGYLRTVCDYVHLNPVRAKLLRGKAGNRGLRTKCGTTMALENPNGIRLMVQQEKHTASLTAGLPVNAREAAPRRGLAGLARRSWTNLRSGQVAAAMVTTPGTWRQTRKEDIARRKRARRVRRNAKGSDQPSTAVYTRQLFDCQATPLH